ncbi:glycine zipper family protein [Niallia endozanthoxylica]|uniref:Uncharacterized protein n=1 Tax=Niallia endozanthoxylica TaxID=2036016 RepID=A0A5J5H3R9_9BACI|nr:glycine zipper family protein [Niallia endozanthoxylica]KAA9014917.1 hypothetical protein F4V44_23260 [Niallia endozanthoxylica]
MRENYKIFIVFSLIILVSTSLFSTPLFATETEVTTYPEANNENSNKQEIQLGPEDPMYGSHYGHYQGNNIYYTLDLASPKDLEEQGWFSQAWDFISLQVVDEKISESLHYSIFFIVDMSFKLNVFMTNIMLAILNFAYNTNILNSLVDSTEGTIKSLTGISGTSFGNTGLFGGSLGLIALLVALYTLYQFIIKKASISAFSGILKSVFALTLALLFFSNYADVLKGAHTVSIDLSAALLSGSIDINVDESNGVIENTTVREKMNDNIFTMFVHKPYLMLQYGTTTEEEIGSERVEELLKIQKSEERTDIVVKEVTEKGNDTLTYASVVNRLVFVGVMTITNAVSSIPIFLLALFLVIFQFWFLVIALIAPFVFLWSAMPNQFGVLKRYFFEMSIPLLLKMGLSVIALVIFGITDVLYNLDTLGGGTQGYIITTLLQSLILFTLFLLRKRIFNVFSLGSKELSIMREQMNSTFINPAKKGISNTLTTGGAIVGAVAAGPQGAMLGANIGGSLGNAVTGESDLSEMTRGASINMMMMDRMNRQAQTRSDNNLSEVNLGDSAAITNENNNEVLTQQHLLEETVQSTTGEMETNNVIGDSEKQAGQPMEATLDRNGQHQLNSTSDGRLTKGIQNERPQLEERDNVLRSGRDINGVNDLSSSSIQGSSIYNQTGQSIPLQGPRLESTPVDHSSPPILDYNFDQANHQYVEENSDRPINLEKTNVDRTDLDD